MAGPDTAVVGARRIVFADLRGAPDRYATDRCGRAHVVDGRLRARIRYFLDHSVAPAPLQGSACGHAQYSGNSSMGDIFMTSATRRSGRPDGPPQDRLVSNAEKANGEELLQESLIETFPASDSPCWTALTRVGPPDRKGHHVKRQKKRLGLPHKKEAAN